jgi:hypothetical protein
VRKADKIIKIWGINKVIPKFVICLSCRSALWRVKRKQQINLNSIPPAESECVQCPPYHSSRTGTIIHLMYIRRTPPTALQSMYNSLLSPYILYPSVRCPFICEFKPKLHKNINNVLTPIRYNCDFILVPATLKMATWVAETCRCLLTFIHSSASVGVIKKMYGTTSQFTALYKPNGIDTASSDRTSAHIQNRNTRWHDYTL